MKTNSLLLLGALFTSWLFLNQSIGLNALLFTIFLARYLFNSYQTPPLRLNITHFDDNYITVLFILTELIVQQTQLLLRCYKKLYLKRFYFPSLNDVLRYFPRGW